MSLVSLNTVGKTNRAFWAKKLSLPSASSSAPCSSHMLDFRATVIFPRVHLPTWKASYRFHLCLRTFWQGEKKKTGMWQKQKEQEFEGTFSGPMFTGNISLSKAHHHLFHCGSAKKRGKNINPRQPSECSILHSSAVLSTVSLMGKEFCLYATR